LLLIGIIGFCFICVRNWLINLGRDARNIKRSIVEARNLNEIESEEYALRTMNSLEKRMAQEDKKKFKKQMKKTGLISGGGVQHGAQFCPSCGGALKPNARFCTVCGNKLNENAKFCGKCGAQVSGRQPQEPQSAAPVSGEPPALKAYNAGLACKEAQRYDEAIERFTEAIRLDPGFDPAYCERAVVYSEIDNLDKAIADLTKSIQIAPNETGEGRKPAWKYYMRGSAYYTKEEYTPAIADYTKAIQLSPESVSPYCGRGFAYAAAGDIGNARADLEKCLQIDPNDDMVIELTGLLNEAGSGAAVCSQCGTPLEESEMFCANCGAKTGTGQSTSPQYRPAPVQTQRQATSEQVLYEGNIILYDSSRDLKIMRAYLYRDRLELKDEQGSTIIVIPIEKIFSVGIFGVGSLRIKMVHNVKYEFFPGLTGFSTRSYVKSWCDAINSVRNGTLG
jgi:tetratricopeptide (TPR) repeat protein